MQTLFRDTGFYFFVVVALTASLVGLIITIIDLVDLPKTKENTVDRMTHTINCVTHSICLLMIIIILLWIARVDRENINPIEVYKGNTELRVVTHESGYKCGTKDTIVVYLPGSRIDCVSGKPNKEGVEL